MGFNGKGGWQWRAGHVRKVHTETHFKIVLILRDINVSSIIPAICSARSNAVCTCTRQTHTYTHIQTLHFDFSAGVSFTAGAADVICSARSNSGCMGGHNMQNSYTIQILTKGPHTTCLLGFAANINFRRVINRWCRSGRLQRALKLGIHGVAVMHHAPISVNYKRTRNALYKN